MYTAVPAPDLLTSSKLHAWLIAIAILISGCAPSGNQVYKTGEFSFSFPSSEYTVQDETIDGPLTSFFLVQKKCPSNRIEFSIYRYEPAFVKTILPSELAKEIQIDVLEIGNRATADVIISNQSGLMIPEEFSLPYTVDAFVIGETEEGEDIVLRISSTQIEHYNVVSVARGDRPETVRSYADILSSFQVTTNQ